MVLLAATIAGSLVGPMNALQPPAKLPGKSYEKAFLITAWRFGPLCVILLGALPLYALYVNITSSEEPNQSEKASKDQETPAKDQEEEEEKPSILKLIMIIILVDMANIASTVAFLTLSFYTVMSHLYLLTNLHGPLTLIVSFLCCGVRGHWLEKVGIFVITFGVTVMILDPSAVKYGE